MRGAVTVRPLDEADRAWARELLMRNWGSTQIVSRRVLYELSDFPGVVAWYDSERAGLAIYRVEGEACEVMLLDSLREGAGSVPPAQAVDRGNRDERHPAVRRAGA